MASKQSRKNNNTNKKRKVRKRNVGRRSKTSNAPLGDTNSASKSGRNTRRLGIGVEIPATYSTEYSTYKNATDRFINYMMDQCPQSMLGGGDGDGGRRENHRRRSSINSLLKIADWMEETNHRVADPTILNDINLAIQMRHRIANSVYGGGNDGHWYLIGVLIYCSTILSGLTSSSVGLPEESLGEKEEEEEECKQENRYVVV